MTRLAGWTCAAMTVLTFCSQPQAPPGPPAKPSVERPAPPRILHFYAYPAECRPGDPVTICYGVENADRVAIHPEVRELVPSFNRCFSVTPRKPAAYTLTALGPGGQATAKVTIAVRGAPKPAPEAPGLLELLSASSQEIARGQQVTLCYVVSNAVAVDVDPPVRQLPPHSFCFTLAPSQTTTYAVTARDEENRQQSRQITVRVR